MLSVDEEAKETRKRNFGAATAGFLCYNKFSTTL